MITVDSKKLTERISGVIDHFETYTDLRPEEVTALRWEIESDLETYLISYSMGAKATLYNEIRNTIKSMILEEVGKQVELQKSE